MQPLPLVYMTPIREIAGADSLTDAREKLDGIPFEKAFTQQYKTDAHFFTYTLSPAEPIPRLKKPVLSEVRKMGGDILATMLVVEYDTPGHRPWQSGEFDQWMADLLIVGAEWPTATAWAVFYPTRNGCRLVYVLTEPVPVDQAEGKTRALAQQFHDHGIPVDLTVWDWTRCFRLPNVTRDGQPPADNEAFLQLDKRFDPSQLPNTPTKVNQYATIIPLNDTRPDEHEARACLSTKFITLAKKLLQGRECYSCLFELKSVAEVGRRGSTLLQYVGQAVSLLHGKGECTPDHIYGLFLDPVQQLEPAKDTPDWLVLLWEYVKKLWAKEEAKAAYQLEKKAAIVAAMGTTMEEMRKWCPLPELASTEKDVSSMAMERHLIAAGKKSYFLLRLDGTGYDPHPVDSHHLIAAIRSKGWEGLIKTTEVSKDGIPRDRPIQHIVSEYATLVSSIWKTVGGLGQIENIDTGNAILRLPSYSLNAKLVPEYCPLVEEWLAILFGDHYEWMMNWIAHSLDFAGGPICAISIKGAPGVGKKMMVQGLAECLTMPVMATAADLIGDYGYGLLESPFLTINEGWPNYHTAKRHPADQFRALVSGDPIVVQRKFQDPTYTNNPLRIIFTANNREVVKALGHNRDLSKEDREAVSIRLKHIEVDDAAAKWLEAKGGANFTKGWIRGDGGAPSDFIVAKHFLWLYQNRQNHGKADGRFLVEGGIDDDIMLELRTRTGSAPVVIEAVLKMLEIGGNQDGVMGKEGRVWGLAGGILEFARKNIPLSFALTADKINNVFKGMSLGEADHLMEFDNRPKNGKAYWNELDANLLLDVAQRDGWPYRKLKEIIDERSLTDNPISSNIVAGS